MGLRTPHILLASSNSMKLLENIKHILDANAYQAIQDEINENVKALFELGQSHYSFAQNLNKKHWRQRISRFYYGAYNVRRAIHLHFNGVYNTDITDHKKFDVLPESFPNSKYYK